MTTRREKRVCIFLVAAVVGTAACPRTGVAALAEVWPSYVNQRFSYVVDYPSVLVRPQPEAGNGDGRKFRARHGVASMAIWGEYAQGASSLHEAAVLRERDCAAGKATYRLTKPALEVTSCVLAAGGVLYWHSQQRKDVIVTLEATYPEAEKATWDPVVLQMVHSIHVSDSEF